MGSAVPAVPRRIVTQALTSSQPLGAAATQAVRRPGSYVPEATFPAQKASAATFSANAALTSTRPYLRLSRFSSAAGVPIVALAGF